MPESQEKSELEILFPEIEVDGFTIRPWDFGKVASMGPILARIFAEVKKAGITLKDIDSRMEEAVMLALPWAPDIVAKTLNLDVEEVRQWKELNKAFKIMLVIFNQNLEHIKNSFGLGGLKPNPKGNGLPRP